MSPDLADENGNVWLLFYSCGAEGAVPRHLGVLGHCPLTKKSFSNEPFYDVPAPPSFAVRVRFTPESGLQHTDLGPVCQGNDCAPRVPVLREAGPDVPDGSCGASSYPVFAFGWIGLLARPPGFRWGVLSCSLGGGVSDVPQRH